MRTASALRLAGPPAVLSLAALAAGVGLVIILWPRPPAAVTEFPTDAPAQAALRSQAVETWTRLTAATAPCDAAVAAVAESTPPPSAPQAPSGPARLAEERCRSASLDLLALKPPSHGATADRLRFKQALEQCQFAYAVEANAHGRLASALEMAAGPSGVDRARLYEGWADIKEARIDALGCRIGFVTAATKAGLPFDLFETGKAST